MSSAHRADVREQLADLHAALAVLLERERRSHQRAGLALGGDRAAGQRLAVVLVEHRLGIEAVDLRQAAVHEQEDDALGAFAGVIAAATSAARATESLTRPANAIMPKPLPMRHSASRRVIGLS